MNPPRAAVVWQSLAEPKRTRYQAPGEALPDAGEHRILLVTHHA
jgi:hypothetical protein